MKAACALLAALLCAPASAAGPGAPPPAAFGNDHDDPRTAYPSPAPADVPACTVEVLHHAFDSFEPARAGIDAARRCPGPWHRIVLRIDGSVKGRQYDRIGHVSVGGVTVFRTSSPEPSREGIAWQVEKDVSAYASLFTAPQPVEMHLGNVVNDTHTGVFDVRLRLQFYPADAAHPPAPSADLVLPLQDLRQDGPDTVGAASLPANAERVVAEVYATGSGGGCEEFWYFAVDAEQVWCRAPQGPYREVQVLIDGRVAGVAAPYPHIYTGGWSNPFLWYAIPAPRAFDIAPIRYELTPFLALFGDGKPHEVRLRVAGLAADAKGWTLMPNLQVWRDAGSRRVVARLLETDPGTTTVDGELETLDRRQPRLRQRWQRRFLARGEARTSHGVVQTTVERAIEGDVHHRWTAQEHEDDEGDHALLGEWRDSETVVRRPSRGAASTERNDHRFGLDGTLQTRPVDGKPRLTTALDLHDQATQVRDGAWTRTRDRFVGTASYTGQVPREQRNATADTRQSWRREDSAGGCAERRIENRNGRFVVDERGCLPASLPRDMQSP
ncbi:peptide-N4-asparagine amidase [Luteimonas aquatica]|uniref:peptide-N4-asparagine amidase n=1 Tax=Luteimonas aquatica TaxID=450364 RepID=UPI001F587A48|nr:peptide-N4-asparagine amidase [Luteimonas aquatica]